MLLFADMSNISILCTVFCILYALLYIQYMYRSFYIILIEYASLPYYPYRVQSRKPKGLRFEPTFVDQLQLWPTYVGQLHIAFTFSLKLKQRPKPQTATYYIVTGGGVWGGAPPPQRALASAPGARQPPIQRSKF